MQSEEINENRTTNQEKAKRLKIMIAILLTLIVCILIAGIAYAKFAERRTGTATAQTANAICTMDITPNVANEEIVNPYCTVTIKNYNTEGQKSEVETRYQVEVQPKGDYQLPRYYWEQDGKIIAQNTNLTGTIPLQIESGQVQQQEHTYKIVFINTGSEDITRQVEFNLTATQAQ